MALVKKDDYTREEAVEEINGCHDAFEHYKRQAMLQIFVAGGAAWQVREQIEYQERGEMYDYFARETGFSANKMRKAVRFFVHFEGDRDAAMNWIRGKNDPHLYHIENLLGAGTDPEVLGREEHLGRTKRRIERLGRDLEEINEAAQAGEIAEEEAEAITRTVLEEVGAFERHGLPALTAGSEGAPVRSEKYLALVRAQPCVVHSLGPGCRHDGKYVSDPHHAMRGYHGGTASKGSDGAAIPLCPWAHQFFHQKGRTAFEERYDTTMWQLVAETQHRVLHGRVLSLPDDPAHRSAYQDWHAEEAPSGFVAPEAYEIV